MTLKNNIKGAMKEAMKAKDKLALETIRSLLSAIQYEEMNKKTEELSDNQVMDVLKAEAKKLRETKEFAEKDGRTETVEESNKRLSVIERFLPNQLEEGELRKIITTFITDNSDSNVGSVMKHLKENFSGQYDGKLASQLVKESL